MSGENNYYLGIFECHSDTSAAISKNGKLLGYSEDYRRTVSIEVGMQNSGLGSELAKKHVSLSAAAPCAISAVYHCIIGSLLAAYWRRKSPSIEIPEKE